MHFTTLYYITLKFTTLHITRIHYTTLNFTTLHIITLHLITLQFTTLNFTTIYSSPHLPACGQCDPDAGGGEFLPGHQAVGGQQEVARVQEEALRVETK